MPFVNPAPGATRGRIDQGVDWGGVRSIVALAAGKITQVYSNLSGFGQTIIEKIGGQYYYYAEETSGVTTNIHAGESVRAGQTLASGGSGSGGIEVGIWNPATGHAAGYQPGVTSGAPTAAGRRFSAMLSGKSTPSYGGTRPGGGSGNTDGQVLDDLYAAYEAELNTPRTAPQGFVSLSKAGWSAPFQWWWQSFTANYEAELAVSEVANAVGSGVSQGVTAANSNIPSTPGSGYNPQTWARALLTALRAPLTQANISSIVAWEAREGGNWNNSARYNPLNTTYSYGGSSVMGGGSSAGVQAYTSWADGLIATIKTLQNGNYNDILAALRSGRGLATGSFAGLSTWSGGGYSSV